MNLFTISDLHLSLGVDKPMDIFHGWENYTKRLEKNWKKLVGADDTVVIGGDISWAISLEEAYEDFKFINSLPGQKIILKGNHDYWWSTVTKINEFLQKNNFDTIKILHNNCFSDGKIAVCGTRGWLYDGTGEKDLKVIKRECGRLETSIKSALDLGTHPLVFLHYPPAYGEFVCEEIVEVLNKYEINQVYYGHIHGQGVSKAPTSFGNIKMRLVSCDCNDFTPIFISTCENFV